MSSEGYGCGSWVRLQRSSANILVRIYCQVRSAAAHLTRRLILHAADNAAATSALSHFSSAAGCLQLEPFLVGIAWRKRLVRELERAAFDAGSKAFRPVYFRRE